MGTTYLDKVLEFLIFHQTWDHCANIHLPNLSFKVYSDLVIQVLYYQSHHHNHKLITLQKECAPMRSHSMSYQNYIRSTSYCLVKTSDFNSPFLMSSNISSALQNLVPTTPLSIHNQLPHIFACPNQCLGLDHNIHQNLLLSPPIEYICSFEVSV